MDYQGAARDLRSLQSVKQPARPSALSRRRLRSRAVTEGDIAPTLPLTPRPNVMCCSFRGGRGIHAFATDPAARQFIERQTACTHRLSVCTGIFALHAFGLLPAGARVTTHRDFLDGLQACGRYDVQHGVRFVRHDDIWSAAGVFAGIDMALAFLEEQAVFLGCAPRCGGARACIRRVCSGALSARIRRRQETRRDRRKSAFRLRSGPILTLL